MDHHKLKCECTRMNWESAWAWARLILKDEIQVINQTPILIMARVQLNERERFK